MAPATRRTYELRLARRLGATVTSIFPEFTVRDGGDGTTVLTASLPDQAALHGALARVRDLGLVLESVRALDDDAAAALPSAHSEAERES